MEISFLFKYFSGKNYYIIFFYLFLIAGCTQLKKEPEPQSALQNALGAHWQELTLNTAPFNLRAYLNPEKSELGVLTIYIEGDGSSWIHGQFPSNDPTPQDPIGLRLALAQPRGAVAYLARPCQFIGLAEPQICHSQIWTSARFSQTVVNSTNQAIDLLKAQTHAQKVVLVGYSGGATIALLVAVQRHDVQKVISVAGNVNPHLWVSNLGMKSLTDSLDPRDEISNLVSTPQVYLVGSKDRVLSPELTHKFVNLFPLDSRPKVIEMKDNDHSCCWVEQWPLLWTTMMRNEPNSY